VSGWVWLALALAALVAVGVATLVAMRVRRLDRLHVRTDAARVGLESALERRAAAALALAAALEAVTLEAVTLEAGAHGTGSLETGALDPTGRYPADGLRAAVAAALATRATGGDREGAENVLSRELAAMPRTGLPHPVLEELVDAEQLLVLARRVHNDAVRDTRVLRSRRLVRWLHLAGSAPMPEYFEIADPEFGVTPAAAVRGRVAPPA
jgi:hypothetical protein